MASPRPKPHRRVYVTLGGSLSSSFTFVLGREEERLEEDGEEEVELMLPDMKIDAAVVAPLRLGRWGNQQGMKSHKKFQLLPFSLTCLPCENLSKCKKIIFIFGEIRMCFTSFVSESSCVIFHLRRSWETSKDS